MRLIRLFQKRAEEIDHAMKQNHFDITESSMGQLKLLRMEFVDFEKSRLNASYAVSAGRVQRH